jgi:hypothetical protein
VVSPTFSALSFTFDPESAGFPQIDGRPFVHFEKVNVATFTWTRYRVYPTPEQEVLLRRAAVACRFVYNLCLEQRILERHQSEPRRLTAYDQIKELTALKDEVPWLRDVPYHPVCQAVSDLDRAFRNFFEGCARFPQFRKRGRRDSFSATRTRSSSGQSRGASCCRKPPG